MKFAFAGIDFLGGVLDGLVGAGWTPIKLFTRPCDGVYDHNEAVIAQARRFRVPIQMSRLLPGDLEALHAAHGRGEGDGRKRHGRNAAARRILHAARDASSADCRIARGGCADGGGDRCQSRLVADGLAAADKAKTELAAANQRVEKELARVLAEFGYANEQYRQPEKN